MMWDVCLGLSIAFLIASVIFAFVRGKAPYKSGRVFTPSKILFVGVIFSAIFLFIPLYVNEFKMGRCGWFETIFISVHNMIRLFIVDGEFSFVTQNIDGLIGWRFDAYAVTFSILFVLAPVLTFGFVLSFFENLSAYKRYASGFFKNTFVFSELNESSLALAESLIKNDRKRLVVFTDVFRQNEEKSFELVERAKELGAICFKKDIVTIDFGFHSKRSELNFFTIGQDQSENLSQSLKLIERMKYCENVKLYVFSTQVESEILLSNAFNQDENDTRPKKIKVRRVNEVRSLINRILYETGFEKIFEAAYDDNSGTKHISAVVVGMGKHGVEMTKALAWFCQMDGYKAVINSFDISESAESEFVSLCPELMDEKFNGRFDLEGETQYSIKVHSGINVNTKEFDDVIASLPKITYVFVALGNDEQNISAAVKLRTLLLRLGTKPTIQAVVYNSDKAEALIGVKNFKNMPYDIDFIGDLKTSYSENVIIDSEVEEKALARHMMWGDEKDFWQYDYNYNSSIASAIHREMKILCDIPGVRKAPADRSEEELWGLRRLEHRRWNAYMRSEGYSFGGDKTPAGRNDLAKIHHCLVPFDELSLKDQQKDDD
jgi:hypothetical protein